MILAGIVTYNPDLERLYENICSVIDQVDKVLVVDNGSKNYDNMISQVISKFDIAVIRYKKNKGIAKALSDIMRYAGEKGYEWVLSLDQDSVCEKDLLKHYKQEWSDPKIGALTCSMRDRNLSEFNTSETMYVNRCITSGMLLRMCAYNKTKGYDERMFIDRVDDDICLSLLEAGYKIKKISYVGLLHELGHATKKKFLGREFEALNHPAQRCYYIERNSIYIQKKHPESLKWSESFCNAGKRIILRFIYEDNRLKKLLSGIKGICDGLMMSI